MKKLILYFATIFVPTGVAIAQENIDSPAANIPMFNAKPQVTDLINADTLTLSAKRLDSNWCDKNCCPDCGKPPPGAVPEPATAFLMLTGISGLLLRKRSV